MPGLPTKKLIALIEPGNFDMTALGTVRTTFNKDGSFLVSLDLNLEDASDSGDGISNGTVVVTEGSDCDSDFNVALANNRYIAIGDTKGAAITKSAFRMDNGRSMKQNRGKAVQIFSNEDSPNGPVLMGCGLLQREVQKKTLVAKMGTYPGYDGDLDPNGRVTVTFDEDDVFTFSYQLKGLLANCDSCGIHIHAGTSCETHELVKGHGWNTVVVEDLWTAAGGATYDSNLNGYAKGFFNLYNGYGYEENEGHAVVIHTQDGARVGCGVLKAK